MVKEQTFPGCQIDVRPLGVLKMLDRGEPDDKILSVPVHDPYQQEFFDIADIPQHMLKEVEHFFHTYKDLEGKRVEIMGWGKSDEAMRIISESMSRYDAAYGRKPALSRVAAISPMPSRQSDLRSACRRTPACGRAGGSTSTALRTRRARRR